MSRPGRLWILAALLPTAALAARLVLASRDAARVEAPPPAAATPATAESWRGEAALTDGGLVVVDLARLHADPERQAFDAGALAGRFGLSSGEPFLLRVERRGGAERAWSLSPVTVHDAGGACLTTVRDDAAPRDGDPVGALLSVPPAPAPGQAAEVVLWGRAPADGARAALGDVEVALARREGAAAELPVARVDARNPGDGGR